MDISVTHKVIIAWILLHAYVIGPYAAMLIYNINNTMYICFVVALGNIIGFMGLGIFTLLCLGVKHCCIKNKENTEAFTELNDEADGVLMRHIITVMIAIQIPICILFGPMAAQILYEFNNHMGIFLYVLCGNLTGIIIYGIVFLLIFILCIIMMSILQCTGLCLRNIIECYHNIIT
jgi:hypothetical protein